MTALSHHGAGMAPTETLAPALRRAAVVTVLRIGLLGLWFFALIRAYRAIGDLPGGLAEAGTLALLMAGIKLFTSALSDPFDLRVVGQVPALAEGPARVAIWRAAQQGRLLAAALVLLAGLALAGPLARHLLHAPDAAGAVRLAALAAALEMAYRGYLSDNQSRERFGRFLALEAALQLLRIAGLLIVARVAGLTAAGFLFAYAGATALVLLPAILLSGAARARLWQVVPGDLAACWAYLRWIVPAMLLAALVERLDIFLLTSLRGAAEAGLYGALLPLLLVPEMVAGFAAHALQPRIAEMMARGQLLRFWGGVLRLTVPLAALVGLGVALLPGAVIAATIGPAYAEAAPALRLLVLAVMAWVAVVPVPLSAVAMARPRLTLTITVVQAGLIAVAGLALIPSHGATGAAVAVLIMRLGVGAMVCAAALRLPAEPVP
ncbi:lipopolysaccharide biosynthesis protein [Gemmobacter caeruleus]|uniref:lipopolysaccharide biosynthesis protein n=1 Tax=Gemmobacter caeruleus TaxID=2595004 RepID=UPI0011EED770|nr:hypothetical protein [Gemmobacter caeruleus]